MFAASFSKPRTLQDWRTMGMFSAFVEAQFTEMYCFPLTLYLLSGWLTEHVPSINWSSHDAGLLQEMLFGWKVNQRFRNGFRRGTSHLHEQDVRIVADFEHGESPPPNRQRGGVRLFPSSVFNG
ncbi:MAG TPA: hypothetical protein PK225_08635 [Azonexus sp.]|nr:hypothetical protein [Azonexus sp.]